MAAIFVDDGWMDAFLFISSLLNSKLCIRIGIRKNSYDKLTIILKPFCALTWKG